VPHKQNKTKKKKKADNFVRNLFRSYTNKHESHLFSLTVYQYAGTYWMVFIAEQNEMHNFFTIGPPPLGKMNELFGRRCPHERFSKLGSGVGFVFLGRNKTTPSPKKSAFAKAIFPYKEIMCTTRMGERTRKK